MKLSLTRINLSEVPVGGYGLTAALCSIIRSNELLFHLDLSWCNLTAKQLSNITKELLPKKEEIRSLNLSYNVLLSMPEPMSSDEAPGERALPPASQEFLDNLYEFLTGNCLVNHLNFSGMGL